MSRNDYIRQNAVDAKWFLALKDIRVPTVLTSLALPATAVRVERERFFESSSYVPLFRPHYKIDNDVILSARTKCEALKSQILQEEDNKSIRFLYLKKLEELLDGLSIIEAAAIGDGELFAQLNKERYGELDLDISKEIVATTQKKYGLFTDMHAEERSLYTISAESFLQAKEKVGLVYLAGEYEERMYSANEVAEIFTREMVRFVDGWEAVVSDTALVCKVDSRHRRIIIPSSLRARRSSLDKLFVHEFGTHVVRREAGKQSPLQLMSIGLHDYAVSEEGLALMREQLVRSHFTQFGGRDKYLALTLATGAVDGVPKDFRQTYETLQEYLLARKLRKHAPEEAERLAQNRAWLLTVRVFRGGDPSMPGSCYRRDKIYREGNVRMWHLFEKNPDFFEHIDAGKFNALDHVQVEALSSLGVLPI